MLKMQTSLECNTLVQSLIAQLYVFAYYEDDFKWTFDN